MSAETAQAPCGRGDVESTVEPAIGRMRLLEGCVGCGARL